MVVISVYARMPNAGNTCSSRAPNTRLAVPASQPPRRELCHSRASASNVLLVAASSAALRACLLTIGFLPAA
ncbi:hypothetical protein D3C78_1562550 [compost metagenome]